jgi:hypothetical protein
MTYSRVLALVLLCFTASHSYSDTTGNLLDPSVIEGTYNNCTPGVNCWNGTSGGNIPNWSGSTAYWGYGGGILRWNIAFQQALESVGIQLDGFNYSWYIKNYDTNYHVEQEDGDDYMRISVRMYDESGAELWGKHYNYDGTYQWSYFTGQELFTTPLPIENVDTILIRAEGDDPGFWAGYYGPEFNVSASSFTLIYSADPCYPDPLYSPTCEGYAEAYANKLLEEQMAAQQEAALAIPEVQESVNQTTPTETFSSPTTTSQVQLGGTTDIGTNPESTGQLTVQEKRDSDDDKKQKLDLVRNLDAANNFDVNSVSGISGGINDGTTAEEIPGMDVVEQVIGESLNGSVDQSLSGLGGLPSDTQASVEAQQTTQTREERQERREKLKELSESRANEIADQNASADSMDEQSQQQMEQLALMNFVPGFNTYQTALPGGMYPDVDFYKPTYVPESKRGLRNGLAQQILHERMVEAQYDR